MSTVMSRDGEIIFFAAIPELRLSHKHYLTNLLLLFGFHAFKSSSPSTRIGKAFSQKSPSPQADESTDAEEKKERYMVDSMVKQERENHVWFAPYNKEFQWMLAVRNPWSNIVYWLDPLRKAIPTGFKVMVDTA